MYMYKEKALHKELKISPFISPATSVWESCFRNRKVGVMDTKNTQHTHSPTQVLLNQRMPACQSRLYFQSRRTKRRTQSASVLLPWGTSALLSHLQLYFADTTDLAPCSE